MGQVPSEYSVNFVLLGMAAMMAAVVRSPILAIILVTELSGSFSHILGLSIATISGYLIAEWLKNPPIYDSLLERIRVKGENSKKLGQRVFREYVLAPDCPLVGKSIAEAGFPPRALVTSIERGGLFETPTAETVFASGDRVIILCMSTQIEEIEQRFSINV